MMISHCDVALRVALVFEKIKEGEVHKKSKYDLKEKRRVRTLFSSRCQLQPATRYQEYDTMMGTIPFVACRYFASKCKQLLACSLL
jgi:hypothetical protein